MWEESSRLSRRGFLGGATAVFLRGAASGSPSAQVDPGRVVSRVTIPPQSGRGVFLKQDQRLKVIAPKGKQVSDLFAFVESSPDEYLCPSTKMSRQRRLYPESGMAFYSNKRRPLLMLEEDTVGVHDLLYPACDEYMYRGWEEPNHPSCRGNLNKVLEELDFIPVGYAEPHNLFQNSPAVDMEGHLQVRESPAKPGDYVLLQALDDLLVVATSCSVDRGVLNGDRPKEIVLEIYG